MATEALTRQLLEWIAIKPRGRDEILDAWRTHCPKLSIWEDACIDGLVECEPGTGRYRLSPAGCRYLVPKAP